ncbi:MAG: DUF6049 family protein [Propionibacteriaceae bacterium]|nr:DUF6049 family protein [Propionibacteriaceae bacterium]
MRKVGTSGWVIRCLIVLCVVLPVVGLAPAAQAVQYQATVTFTSVTTDDQGVTLTGTVLNTGTDPLYRAQVVLWRDRTPLTTQDQLDTALAVDPMTDTGDRIIQDGSVTVICSGTDTFASGATANFSVSASWADLGLTADAVYLVGVHVRGADVSWGSQVTIGRGRTLVTVANATQATTATVVMLTSAPSLLHDSVFVDDHLTEDLAGRLSTLLDLAHQPGVSWAIDPALYHEISVMAQGYSVTDGTTTTPGKGQAKATAWLASFKTLDTTQGYRLPWGNPDLALGASTNSTAMLATAQAAEQANPALDSLPLLVRAANGQADDAFLTYVATLQPAIVLAASAASATLPQGRLLNTMSTAFPGGPGPDVDTSLQQSQRAIAEDALSGSTVIRVVDTAADANLASQPLPAWVTPVALSAVDASQGWDPDMSAGQPSGPLTEATLTTVAPIQSLVSTYASLTGDQDGASRLTDAAQASILSQSWAGDDAAQAYAGAVRQWLSSVLNQVSLIATTEVTLTSHTTSFPVTVTNKLSVPVLVRLSTTVTPAGSSMAIVTVPTTDVVTIQPGDRLPVILSPTVVREGDANAIVRLTTPDGLSLGPQASVTIHAQGSSWMIFAVFAAAVVLLMAGTFLRVKNRQKYNREGKR